MAETGTIYYVKYLYSEIAMHIISILSSESIGEYCLVIKINEWVIVVQRQISNFSAILWREQVNLQWDDNEVRFVLDQHT
jgi:hypothetical protein